MGSSAKYFLVALTIVGFPVGIVSHPHREIANAIGNAMENLGRNVVARTNNLANVLGLGGGLGQRLGFPHFEGGPVQGQEQHFGQQEFPHFEGGPVQGQMGQHGYNYFGPGRHGAGFGQPHFGFFPHRHHSHHNFYPYPQPVGIPQPQPVGFQPYPDGPQPFPGGFQPYPEGGQQGGYQPAPDVLQPNPDGPKPFPGGNQPQPEGGQQGGHQPGSDVLQPNLDGPQPFPGANQPQPEGNQAGSNVLQPNPDGPLPSPNHQGGNETPNSQVPLVPETPQNKPETSSPPPADMSNMDTLIEGVFDGVTNSPPRPNPPTSANMDDLIEGIFNTTDGIPADNTRDSKGSQVPEGEELTYDIDVRSGSI